MNPAGDFWGAFIIYERGGGGGENVKISIFFQIPPKYLNFFGSPRLQFNFFIFLKCQDAPVLFDKMYHICLKSSH